MLSRRPDIFSSPLVLGLRSSIVARTAPFNGPREPSCVHHPERGSRVSQPLQDLVPIEGLVSSPPMPEISPTEARQQLDAGAQLVDVRTDEEFEAGRIP